MGPDPPRRVLWPAALVVVLAATSVGLVLAEPAPGTVPGLHAASTDSYVLPRSAFNITDHNLTYATNGFFLRSVIAGSFEVSLANTLQANGQLSPDRTEAQIGIGPVPAGPDESNITPLFIVQEAGSGLLRIEYIPFPMNDTYGYVLADLFLPHPGPQPFAGHVLTLQFIQTAPGVPPYIASRPYGQTTGNVTVTWDGVTLVPHYPVAWSSFGALYAYGLSTDGFGTGAVFVNVTTLVPDPGVLGLGATPVSSSSGTAVVGRSDAPSA